MNAFKKLVTIILYDGVCGLCNRLNQFILKRDRHDTFHFAALQHEVARRALARHRVDRRDSDTLYVVVDYEQPTERLFDKSSGVVFVLRQLGGISGALAAVLRAFPRPIRDFGYDQVARIRYRVFGRYDSCPLPEVRHRVKFLDL